MFDHAAFRNAFLVSDNLAFDFDGDNDVDSSDFLAFVPRFLLGGI